VELLDPCGRRGSIKDHSMSIKKHSGPTGKT